MKCRFLSNFLSSVTLTILSGCGSSIGYEISTIIASDGVVVRETSVTTDDNDEVDNFYTLPADGKWSVKEEKYVDSNGKEYIIRKEYYQAHHRYERGESIPSDYLRKAKYTDRVSQNIIQPQVFNLWFLKLIDFEETYPAVTDKESAIASGKKLYAMWKELSAERSVDVLEGRITKSEVKAVISRVFDPKAIEYESIIRRKEINSPSQMLRLFDEDERVKNLFDADLIKEPLVKEFNKISDIDNEKSDEIIKLIGQTFLSLITAEVVDDKQEVSELVENLLGLTGFTLNSYPFEVSLSIPGLILDHN